MTAAYAEPWPEPTVMISPAFDHGTTAGLVLTGCPFRVWLLSVTSVSDVTRTVMLPSPVSGRCTK